MVENGGKWGKWEEMGNCYKYITDNVGKCSKKKEKKRKLGGGMGEKWDMFRQLPHFSRSHFSKG